MNYAERAHRLRFIDEIQRGVEDQAFVFSPRDCQIAECVHLHYFVLNYIYFSELSTLLETNV
jgi:hypothetical protein